MDQPMVSVVIPAYNEGSHIEQTINSVATYLSTIEDRYRWEVIVVDDGSTDDTLAIAEAAATGNPAILVAPHPANFNLGQALRYGFSVARGDYIVTLDADLSYAPEHIGRLLEAISTSQAKIVIASPYMKGGTVEGVPAVRLAASRTANRLLSNAAKGHLTTVTGMVRAYDAVFLKRLDLKAMDVEINAEIIYKAQLMRAHIAEIPADLTWARGQEDGSPPKFRPYRSSFGPTPVFSFPECWRPSSPLDSGLPLCCWRSRIPRPRLRRCSGRCSPSSPPFSSGWVCCLPRRSATSRSCSISGPPSSGKNADHDETSRVRFRASSATGTRRPRS